MYYTCNYYRAAGQQQQQQQTTARAVDKPREQVPIDSYKPPTPVVQPHVEPQPPPAPVEVPPVPPQPAVQVPPVPAQQTPVIQTQIEEPPPQASGSKRKEPDTPAEEEQETPLLWYQIGEMINGFRYVKADTVPNQKRIQGRMTDMEKLQIARENAEKRRSEQDFLEASGIFIKYIGKNTPMGIPGQGYYDEHDPSHKLAVIKVGSNRRTLMQRQLQDEIAQIQRELDHAAARPPPVKGPCTFQANVKGKLVKLYLYEKREQITTNERNWFQVHNQPNDKEINVTIDDLKDMEIILSNAFRGKMGAQDIVNVYNHISETVHYNVNIVLANTPQS